MLRGDAFHAPAGCHGWFLRVAGHDGPVWVSGGGASVQLLRQHRLVLAGTYGGAWGRHCSCRCDGSSPGYDHPQHNAAYYVEPSQEPKATATASSASGSSAKDMLQRRTQGEDTVAPLPSRRRAPHIAVPLMATSFRGNQRFVQQSQRSRSATRRHEVFLTAYVAPCSVYGGPASNPGRGHGRYRRVDEDIRVELQHILDSAAMDLKGNVQHASARSRRLRHDDNGRGRSKPSLLSSDGLATTAASAGAGGAASNGGSTDITRANDVHLQVVP